MASPGILEVRSRGLEMVQIFGPMFFALNRSHGLISQKIDLEKMSI